MSGSDLVGWLQQKVEGLSERRDARKYASNLLKLGYIRHTVNKQTFSEQCYYVFGECTASNLPQGWCYFNFFFIRNSHRTTRCNGF